MSSTGSKDVVLVRASLPRWFDVGGAVGGQDQVWGWGLRVGVSQERRKLARIRGFTPVAPVAKNAHSTDC